MFYKEIIEVLRTDQAVSSSVSTYQDSPAIFSEEAPEKAKRPYIVIRIDSVPTTDRTVSVSNLFIDYYDFQKSRVKCNQYALDLVDLLDFTRLRTKEVNNLRIMWSSDGYIPDTDPRDIHFNSTFGCRGARSGWMNRTKTT